MCICMYAAEKDRLKDMTSNTKVVKSIYFKRKLNIMEAVLIQESSLGLF